MFRRFIILGLCSVFCLASPAQAFLWFKDTTPSGNPSNDKLRMMSEDQQAATLGKAIGNICTATNPYYNGTEKHGVNTGVAFWSITCKENKSAQFMIIIAPDAVGSTRIIQCNLLHGKPWACYEQLKY